MMQGDPIVAPQGFGQMDAGVTYRFIGCHYSAKTGNGRAFLVRFQSNLKNTQLVCMQQDSFAAGCASGLIVLADVQSALPPWLSTCEGATLEALDSPSPSRPGRRPRSLTNEARIDAFLLKAAPALTGGDLFAADNPEAHLNKLARQCGDNETRFRTKVLTFLGCGRNKWALLPNYYGTIGKWSRTKRLPAQGKYGRPSLSLGRGHGHPATDEMRTRMLSAFIKHAKLGDTFDSVYDKAMRKEFGATTRRSDRGVISFYQAEGTPLPTFGQFRYWIVKSIGLRDIQELLYGGIRTRNRLRADEGKFSEQYVNLMVDCQSDSYFVSERPTAMLSDDALPPMSVNRANDSTSHLLTGIGFALGSETSDAYRLTLFCMAVRKDWFCAKLFGKVIRHEDWPSLGLCPSLAIDRGPGSAERIIDRYKACVPQRSLAPTNQARSKSGSESGHPRERHVDEGASFVQSKLNPIQLARKEIERLILDNRTSDARGQMTARMKAEGVMPTPLGIWAYLDERGHNSAVPVSLVDAITWFLTPKSFVAKIDGLWLGDLRYDSDDLRRTDLFEKVGRFRTLPVSGFVYDFALRTAWVMLGSRPVEVQMQQSLRVPEDDHFFSSAEYALVEERMRIINSEFRNHRRAAKSHAALAFEAETGQPWDSGRRRRGKVNSGAKDVKAEVDQFRRYNSSKTERKDSE